MKPELLDPVERVTRRLLGSDLARPRHRKIGIWWPRDENGEPRLAVGTESEHLRPNGVRYRRFVRLRQRLHRCDRCDGSGCDPEPIPHETTVARCCGRSEWECGGRGCVGPEPDLVVDWEWGPCRSCGGFGTRSGNRTHWATGYSSRGTSPPP